MCRFDSQGKACRVAVTITVLFVQWMFKNGVQERNVGLALCVNLLLPPPQVVGGLDIHKKMVVDV